jgi:hypothetical protein
MICGLYHKPITIVDDNSSGINKLENLLTDDARVAIYNSHMFIVQALGSPFLQKVLSNKRL